MPGSLGVQAILQAMRAYARWRYRDLRHARVEPVKNQPLTWRYRGQVTPQDPELILEVHLHPPVEGAQGVLLSGDANVWKSGIRIYEIKGAAIGFRQV